MDQNSIEWHSTRVALLGLAQVSLSQTFMETNPIGCTQAAGGERLGKFPPSVRQSAPVLKTQSMGMKNWIELLEREQLLYVTLS